MLGIRHALGTRGRGMGMDAVAASIGNGDGDVDHLLRQRVELRRGCHHSLHLGPGALQQVGIERQGTPEVIDEVGLAGRADVVEYRFDSRICFRIRRLFDGGHGVGWGELGSPIV